MTKPAVMIGLGEVLWDILPSGRVLGGAPANFAYMANVLGDEGTVATRVGTDGPGDEACRVMQGLGVNISYVQKDSQYETGTATVEIDPAGQPTFTIKQTVSWDFLQWTKEWEELSARARVICFGTLAQRSPESAATIDRFLRSARADAVRICDANLRQAFFSEELLRKSFGHAHIVKLNDQELLQASYLLKLGPGSEATLARQLLKECDLTLVCITRGARGSLLVSENEMVDHNGFRVKVTDAVGAGDAFTACLAHHYLRGHSLDQISETANRFAAWVATQVGATPLIERSQLKDILRSV